MIFRRRVQLELEQRGKSTKRQVNDAEITKERVQLWHKIEKLRVLQKDVMPQVEPHVIEQHI